MTTFVLVPGFWLGGWAWEETARALTGRGHAAHAVTLGGLDGSDPAAVTAETHVEDIVRAVDRAGSPVVLVGHSGGGPIAAAAADRRPGLLAHLVHVDTGALPDGWAQVDFHPPATAAALRAALTGTPTWPMPSDAEFDAMGSSRAGVDATTWARVRARSTGQPTATVLEPLRRGEREPGLPKTIVACSFPAEAMPAMAERFPELADPEWSVRELPTGHWPMFSRPDDLAAVLADLPLRTATTTG